MNASMSRFAAARAGIIRRSTTRLTEQRVNTSWYVGMEDEQVPSLPGISETPVVFSMNLQKETYAWDHSLEC